MMKKLITTREFHGSYLMEIEWRERIQLRLGIEFDDGSTADLFFHDVKNRPTIEHALDQIDDSRTHGRWRAEIVGLLRLDSRRLIVDTDPQPSLVIECSSFLEC